MSRVSDAMQRAGHQPDGDYRPVADETAFEASGEDMRDRASSDDRRGHVLHGGTVEPAPEPEKPGPVVRGELVPQSFPIPPLSSIPIEIPSDGGSGDLQLRDVLRVLYRRRSVIAVIVAACVALAALYNHLTPRVYEARARLIIDPVSQEVVPFRPARAEDPSRFDYFLTQMEVLRSRTIARKTLEQLKVLDADQTRAMSQIATLRGSLRVSSPKSEAGGSRVVDVHFRAKDPAAAARMADAVANAYVAENLEGLRQSSREASEWLKEQLADLQRTHQQSEKALQEYREQNVSLGDQENVVMERFKHLSGGVTEARMNRVAKETNYAELQRLQQSKAPLDTFAPILANTTIQSIKTDIGNLELKRRQEIETKQPTHPDVQEIDGQLQTARKRLDAETQTIVNSIRNEYQVAQAQERELAGEFNKQTSEVIDLFRKSIPYNSLERQASSNQQIVQAMVQKLSETQLSGKLPTNNVRLLDTADVPTAAILPRTQLNLVIALLAGIIVALATVFLVEYLNPRLSNPDEVAGALGVPLLGATPVVRQLGTGPAALSTMPGAFQEAIRGIRTHIFLSPAPTGFRTLAVTSARPGEGKTVVASNLAVSMAMVGRRVLLIDGDLRHAQLRHVFNVRRAPGLSNVIVGGTRPSEALVESAIKGLYILPAGDELANPGDLLDGERLNQLIRGLKHVFDVVVIDCPPVMAVADATIVANAATSVVFVVGSGGTSRAVARQALERLTAVRAHIVGVVMNKVKGDLSPEDHELYFTPDAANV